MNTITNKLNVMGTGSVCMAILLASILSASAEPPDTPIRSTISTPRDTYLVGEPLVLDLILTNEGRTPLTLMMPNSTGERPFRLFYKEPDESDWTAYTPATRVNAVPRYAQLEPGEELVNRGIFVGRSQTPFSPLLLNQPGTYEFRMEGSISDGSYPIPEGGFPRAISNTIAVTVREPQGREAEAFELWYEALKEGGYRLSSLAQPEQEQIRLLVEEYGDTTYAQYSNYFLASTTRRLLASQLEGRSADEYRSEHLERVLETAPADFPLRDEALYRLADYYRSQRRLDEAIALLDHLISEMPDSIKAYEAIERRELFESHRTSVANR